MVRLIIVWNCSVSPRLNKGGAGVLVSKMKKKKRYYVIYIIQTLNKHIDVFILPFFSGLTLSL